MWRITVLTTTISLLILKFGFSFSAEETLTSEYHGNKLRTRRETMEGKQRELGGGPSKLFEYPGGNPSIVGGSPASEGDYQFFVRPNGGPYLCGGSLVRENFVLSAAHCADAFRTSSELLIGPYDMRDTADTIKSRVAGTVVHPEYNQRTTANDIMLIQLSSPVTTIDPVTVEASTVSTGQDLTVMGFGTTSSGGRTTSVLYDVRVNAVSDAQCDSDYSRLGGIDEEVMFCAAAPGKDSCQGDSGGPIIDTETKHQVGIVSWGIGCADEDYPGVYTRLSHFTSWIDEEICKISSDQCNVDGGTDDGGDDGDGTGNGGDDGTGDSGGDETDGGEPEPDAPTVRIVIQFDANPTQTWWEIKNSSGRTEHRGRGRFYEANDQRLLEFPDASPGEYTLTMRDTAGNGFCCERGQGYYEIYINGVLEERRNGDFSSRQITSFTVPDESTVPDADDLEPEKCIDSTDEDVIPVSDTRSENCSWLGRNVENYQYLCTLADVALNCPKTCGICEDLQSVQDSDCTDKPSGSSVLMDDSVGTRACDWLGNNKVYFGQLCGDAKVVLHCPQTCGYDEIVCQ